MFSLAILIGVYSYLIFSLGILGFLYKEWIIFSTLAFGIVVFFLFGKKVSSINLSEFKKIPRSFLLFLAALALVNLVGALGPELGFDALWYHLTLPKIFLLNHRISHISGGLLYYSDMPKLMEMIYASSLSVFNEIAPKVIHFLFGILSIIAIYNLSRKFLNPKFSVLACMIFYSNLVVGWQSTTAYIDLGRTFFEVMAFWGLLNWNDKKKPTSARRRWFIESAVMLGLAIATKLLSFGTLFIFIFLIVFLQKKINLRQLFTYFLISLYVVLPWLIFSYLSTGSPFYPLFTSYINSHFNLSNLNPIQVSQSFWNFFIKSSDPISPIYLIFLPLIVFSYKRVNSQIKSMIIYFALSLLIWYFFPAKDSRYMLPGLAALSTVTAYLVQSLKDKFLKNSSVLLITTIAVTSIFYRGAANFKYIPVIFGYETKDHFLTQHLNFRYGDFYDTDGYFKKHIVSDDKILLYGFHNLYYVNFLFIDSSYVNKGDIFNYVAVQNGEVPDRFKSWSLIYSNKKTGVMLYTLGGQKWIY